MFGTIHTDGKVIKKKKIILSKVKTVCIHRGTGHIHWDFWAVGNVPFPILNSDYMDIHCLTILKIKKKRVDYQWPAPWFHSRYDVRLRTSYYSWDSTYFWKWVSNIFLPISLSKNLQFNLASTREKLTKCFKKTLSYLNVTESVPFERSCEKSPQLFVQISYFKLCLG